MACPVKNFYIDPFVVGIYHGLKKPNNAEEFLKSFVEEVQQVLTRGGVLFNDILIKFTLNCFIFDAPAKAMIAGIKSHTGYFGYSKCTVEGDYVENRVVFLELNSRVRTDQSFAGRLQPEHHLHTSALEALPIGIISQIPLDYMHLVCLEVVKRILQFWVKGKMNVRLKPNQISKVSTHLLSMSKSISVDFARKPRSLEECDRCKATQFRQFLLYTGPIVLLGTLQKRFYTHFMCLHIAIRILVDKKYCYVLNGYAQELLEHFVKKYSDLYGVQHVSYNVHNLIHLSADVKLRGPLDRFSAFRYENMLYKLKRKVKSASKPLEQISNRIMENLNN